MRHGRGTVPKKGCHSNGERLYTASRSFIVAVRRVLTRFRGVPIKTPAVV